MKKSRIYIGGVFLSIIGIILATALLLVVNIFDSGTNTKILKQIKSPDNKNTAILYNHSSLTTPYVMGVSIIPTEDVNKEINDIVFNEHFEILMTEQVFDENANIEWENNNKLIIKFDNLKKKILLIKNLKVEILI